MSRASHFVAILLVSAGLACAAKVDVVFLEDEDFSRHHTWDWAPRVPRVVDAPIGVARDLEALLSRHVERELEEKGLRRARTDADILIRCHLSVHRQTVLVNATPAMQQLDSMHSSGSYQVQATRREMQVYEDSKLSVVVTDRDGKPIWRGLFEARFPGEFAPRLQGAVSRLLEDFPPQSDPDSGEPMPVTGPVPL